MRQGVAINMAAREFFALLVAVAFDTRSSYKIVGGGRGSESCGHKNLRSTNECCILGEMQSYSYKQFFMTSQKIFHQPGKSFWWATELTRGKNL